MSVGFELYRRDGGAAGRADRGSEITQLSSVGGKKSLIMWRSHGPPEGREKKVEDRKRERCGRRKKNWVHRPTAACSEAVIH